METTEVKGTKLAYEERGSGEPLLLISLGPFSNSFLPFSSQAVLADRYRLITYRQRRATRSSDGIVPVSVEEHAADAAQLLDELGIRRAHVAGHSSGATIALQLACDRPDIVHSLTLLEPPLFGVASAETFFEKAQFALEAYADGDRGGAMASFMSMVCSRDWETCRRVIEASVPGAVADALANADNFFGSYLPALSAWQFGAAEAATISQPVLSVVGTETEQLFRDSHEMLYSWFPQLEECRVEGATHLLHLQGPEPVAAAVAGFLSRHAIARG